jgi:hypothetical protein
MALFELLDKTVLFVVIIDQRMVLSVSVPMFLDFICRYQMLPGRIVVTEQIPDKKQSTATIRPTEDNI